MVYIGRFLGGGGNVAEIGPMLTWLVKKDIKAEFVLFANGNFGIRLLESEVSKLPTYEDKPYLPVPDEWGRNTQGGHSVYKIHENEDWSKRVKAFGKNTGWIKVGLANV